MIESAGQEAAGITNLYLVLANASEFSSGKIYFGLVAGDFGYNGDVPLPPEWLQIREKTLVNSGITNANGSVSGMTLISAPAGKNWDVTPVATNVYDNMDYTFDVQATNVSLVIIDTNTGDILTGTTNTVIVGQQMDLTCELNVTNSILMNSMLTNFQWTVSGYAISNYVVAPDTNTATVVTNFPTTNSVAHFFWVDDGSNRIVQCSVIINGATVSGQAVFNVLKPMATVTNQTGAVGIGYADDGIRYGVYFGNNSNPPGILFSNSVTMPSGTSYNYGNTNYQLNWVQTIVPTYSATIEVAGTAQFSLILTATNVVLDNVYPYGFSHNYPYPDTDDGPGVVTTYSPQQVAASFSQKSEMWLMFRPANGQWVPLRTVNWVCSGAATNSESGWTLTSANWSTNPPDADAGTVYPTWTNNISNIPFQTNYLEN